MKCVGREESSSEGLWREVKLGDILRGAVARHEGGEEGGRRGGGEEESGGV